MSTQRQRHTAEDPRAHRIPRGTGRITRGIHNRGPQRTVESQRDKTQAHDETQKIATRSCTPSDPHHAPQAPQQIQRIPKTPAAQPRNQPPTPYHPCTPEPPTTTPEASSLPKAPSHTHEPHKTQGLIWQLSFKWLRYRITVISRNQ